MKKKAVGILTSLLLVGVLAGCSAGENRGTALKDWNVEKYVTLGEYKGLEVTVSPVSIDQEQCLEITESIYQDALSMATGVVVEDGILDRAVAEGDVICLDYEGKKDGVAFAGGTAQNAYLGIGSGRFIEGFEEGLVGVMPGETIDLSLTFPENYSSTDLAGQEVVFTVKVNYIMPEGYHEDVIALLGMEGVTNGEEMEQFVYDYLYAMMEQNHELELQNAVMSAFMEQCKFEELPDYMLEKYETAAREGIARGASSAGVDEDTYCQYYYGMTKQQLLEEQVPEVAKQDIALQAVANRENLNISDEELNATLSEYAQNAGFSTVEEYLQGSSLEDYREYLLYDKVLQYLADHAVITE
ncbi:MAG: FKBP-type peptidyl-prolyl cis-trans isomerase [Lachnospiraceae bacterium]|nr:FKBP-type peptidyl-prolyl cis-trans isomerase [Lachnospiraceae bacterium]